MNFNMGSCLDLIIIIISVVVLIAIFYNNYTRTAKYKFYIFFVSVIIFFILRSNIYPKEQNFVSDKFFVIVFLCYMLQQIIRTPSNSSILSPNFFNYQSAFETDFVDAFEEGVALIDKETRRIYSHNRAFKREIIVNLKVLSIEEILSSIESGKDTIEIKDIHNDRKIYQFWTRESEKNLILLYFKIVTSKIDKEERIFAQSKILNLIWDSTEDFVFILDDALHLTYFNQAATIFFKHLDIGKALSDIFSNKNEYQILLNKISAVKKLSNYSVIQNEILRFTQYDGSVHYLKFRIQKMVSGEICSIFVSAENYTIEQRNSNLNHAYYEIFQSKLRDDFESLLIIDFESCRVYFSESLKKSLAIKSSNLLDFYNGLDLIGRDYLDAVQLNKNIPNISTFTYNESKHFWIDQMIKNKDEKVSILVLKHFDQQSIRFSKEIIGKKMLKHMTEGYMIVNYEGVIETTNDNFVRMIGYNQEEIIGNQLSDISTDPANDQIRKNWLMALYNESVRYDSSFITKNGLVKNLDVTVMKISEIGIDRILMIIKDLTPEDNYKIEMLTLQNTFTNTIKFFDYSSGLMALPNRSVIINQNEVGFEHPIQFNLSYDQYLNLVDERDRDGLDDMITQLIDQKCKRNQYNFRVQLNDQVHWVESNYILSEEDNLIYFANNSLDTIKQFELEVQKRQIALDALRPYIKFSPFTYDIDTKSFVITSELLDLFDIPSKIDRLTFDEFLSLITPLDREYFEVKFNNAINEESEFDIIVRFIRYGQTRYLRVSGNYGLAESYSKGLLQGYLIEVTEYQLSNIKGNTTNNSLDN